MENWLCKAYTVWPVSYTHLDVYKRQVYYRYTALFRRYAVELAVGLYHPTFEMCIRDRYLILLFNE